mmetsp:Transcript_1516/g.2007  ORF Transcript_1516/g.2007 Transcript_1516/m.2007 type:complete len:136 (-) Transcript_1516:8-415(-)
MTDKQQSQEYSETQHDSPVDADHVDANSKNARTIHCPMCNSKVLKPGMGKLVEKQIFLHSSRQKSGQTDGGSTLTWFWKIEDMFDFENIGFTKNVDPGYKYLTCADCEQTVLGIQQLNDPNDKALYLSCSRVKYL